MSTNRSNIKFMKSTKNVLCNELNENFIGSSLEMITTGYKLNSTEFSEISSDTAKIVYSSSKKLSTTGEFYEGDEEDYGDVVRYIESIELRSATNGVAESNKITNFNYPITDASYALVLGLNSTYSYSSASDITISCSNTSIKFTEQTNYRRIDNSTHTLTIFFTVEPTSGEVVNMFESASLSVQADIVSSGVTLDDVYSPELYVSYLDSYSYSERNSSRVEGVSRVHTVRLSSPEGPVGTPLGELSDGDVIYRNDVIYFYADPLASHEAPTITYTENNPLTVTSDIDINDYVIPGKIRVFTFTMTKGEGISEIYYRTQNGGILSSWTKWNETDVINVDFGTKIWAYAKVQEGYSYTYNTQSKYVTVTNGATSNCVYNPVGTRLSAVYRTGPIPTGVASITAYRKLWNGTTFSIINNGDIVYYGDQIYFTATAATGFGDPVITYYDSSHALTVVSNQILGSDYVSGAGLLTYKLTITKGTGISKIFYKLDSGSWIEWTSGSVSISYGQKVYCYATPANGYSYQYNSTTAFYTVSENVTGNVSFSATGTANPYAVTIAAGTGVTSVYTSSTYTAESGNPTNTKYNYNTIVYGFVVLDEGYKVPSGKSWVLVKGTANTKGAIYRVGNGTVTTSGYAFGTINAEKITYTVTFTKGTGISNIYYKLNSGNWTNKNSGSITIDYGTAVYCYATPATGYSYQYNSTSNYTTLTSKATAALTFSPAGTVLSYTFTLTKNAHVKSISVSRTSSPKKGAATGVLLSASGTATIYHSDVLSGTATADTGYTLNQTSYSLSEVTGNVTWAPTATANKYKVYLSGGLGISAVYTATSSTAKSGNASGYEYTYGTDTTIYAFVKLADGYQKQTGWTLVSGTDNTKDAIYNVSSATLGAANYDFGEFAAKPKQYAVKIAAGTGISSVYLSASSTATSGSASGTKFDYSSTVYGFATISTGYAAPSTWTHISGSTYRIGSKSVTTSGADFGTVNISLSTHTIKVEAGENITSVAIGTSPTNTNLAFSTSVTQTFNYGTDIYIFVVNEHPELITPNTWVLVSGNIYRHPVYTVTADYDFGRIALHDRKTFTYKTGTLPTGIDSITGYRMLYNGSTYSTISNNATINYGDKMYFKATASTGYKTPTISKDSSSNYLSVTSNVTGTDYVTSPGLLEYTFTITKPNTISTIYYRLDSGSWVSLTASGTVTVKYGQKVECYATPASGYSYDYNSASNCTVITSKVTGNISYSPAGTPNPYGATIAAGNGISAVYTSTSSTATSGNASGYKYNYGTTVYGFAKLKVGYNAVSGWTKVSGNDNSENAIYRVGSKTIGTSGADFGTINASIKTFAVSITAGTGVTNVYLSTTSNAASGSASGTTYNYGTKVYGFAKLAEGYNAASGWTLVSGTANSTGAIYCIGEQTVTATYNFGTVNASIKTYTFTLTAGTGISKMYYRIDSGNWIEQATGSVAVEYGDVITAYATPATGYSYTYNSSSNATTISNKVTGNISFNPTGTVLSYTFTLTKKTNVSDITITRSSSPYKGAATGTLISIGSSESGSKTATIYYGDVLSGTANPVVGYSMSESSYRNTGVTGNVTWAPTASINYYAVKIAAGTGLSSVYLSTSSTATSGDASGKEYSHGTTVYAFAKITAGYQKKSGWTLVSGTDNTANAIYNIGSQTVTATYNFGTISATPIQYAVKIAAGTGIDSVYLSASSTATSGSASGTKFDYNSTVYGFAKVKTGYVPSTSWSAVDATNRIYRIGSKSVTTSGADFGTVTTEISKFTISVNAGVNVTQVAIGTSPTDISSLTYNTAVSGVYNYGTKIYVFAVVEEPQWAIPSSWTLISAPVYRVMEHTVTDDLVIASPTTTTRKTFKYTTGTPPTGVASITAKKANYNSTSFATLANNSTITYGDKIYFSATAATGYNAPTVSKNSSSNYVTVTNNVTGANYVTAGGKIKYTITFTKPTNPVSISDIYYKIDSGNWTKWTSGTVNVDYGSAVYCYAVPATGYSYAYDSSTESTTLTTSATGNLSFSPVGTINKYGATIAAGTGISAVYTSTSSDATSGNASGYQYNYGTTVYGFAKLKEGYNAASGWTLVSGNANSTNAIYCIGSRTIGTSEAAFGTVTATLRTYTITFTKGTGISTIYYKLDSGSWTAWSGSGTVSVNYGQAVYCYATPSTGYSYTYSSSSNAYTVSEKVTANVSFSATGTINAYAVTITKGTGVSEVYLSTSSGATSGYVSGTNFNYNTTVYGFAKLAEGYNAASGWTLVSGTANSTGAIYCIGSKKVTTSGAALGTATATIKTFTLTLSAGTGISKVYYRIGSSGSFTEKSSGTVSVNYGSAVYGYATPSTEYNYTNNSSSNPYTISSKVTGNISYSPTGTRKTFTYTTGTLPTGVASITAYRKAWNGSSFATISSGATISYGDMLYFTATASTEYNTPTVSKNSSSNYVTATGNITGTSYVTAGSRKSYTYSTGTLPTGVASITAYRKAWNGSSFAAISNGTSIAYGDMLYFTATASEGYNNPTVSKNNSSNYVTVTAAVTGTSYVTAGSRKTFTYTTGTLPTGVASIRAYRCTYNGSSFAEISNNTTISYGDKIYFSATASTGYNAPTVSKNSSSNYVTVTAAITGTSYVTAGAVLSYTFTLTKNTNVSSISVSRTSSPYKGAATGTLLSDSGTATIYYGDKLSGTASAATGCTMSQTSYSNSGVTGNASWSPTASVNYYAVTFAAGSGVDSIYLSTSSTATSGDASGKTYAHGTTVYVFAKVSTGYSAPSTWSLVSGTTYRVASSGTLTAAYNFGTIGATINQYSVTIAKGTGVSSVYLSTTSTATSGSPSGTKFNYGSTVYGFATLQTGYSPNSSWTHITGTTYRVGSKSVGTSGAAFGTISVGLSTYTISAVVGENVTAIGMGTDPNDVDSLEYLPSISRSYSYGTTVYLFAVNERPELVVPSGWVLVKDVIYRVAQYTVTDNFTFSPPSLFDRKSFSYSTGTLPTGVASITAYRALYNNVSSYSVITSDTTIYYGDRIYFSATAASGYQAPTVSKNSSSNYVTVTGNVVGANYVTGAGVSTYKLTITKGTGISTIRYKIGTGDWTNWSSGTVNVSHGQAVYCYATPATGYSYQYNSTSNYTTLTTSATGNLTFNPVGTVLSYTFTLTKNSNVNSISISRTSSPKKGAATGTLLNKTGTATIYYGDVLSGTATANTGYTMSQTSYSNSGVTGNASWSPTASINQYVVTITKGTGISEAFLSTTIDATSGSTTGTKFNHGSTVYGFVKLSAGYNAASGWTKVSGTANTAGAIYRVATASSITSANDMGTFNATIQRFPVTITKGTGVSSVYLSTNISATSGDASGTYYNYNTTVYGFAKLAAGYNAASGWTKVSGTANSTGAIYLIGSKTTTASQNFGTVNASIKTYTFTITKGTGISTIYYKLDTGSWTKWTTGTVSVKYGQKVYAYAVPSDGYSYTYNSTTNYATVSTSVSGNISFNPVGTIIAVDPAPVAVGFILYGHASQRDEFTSEFESISAGSMSFEPYAFYSDPGGFDLDYPLWVLAVNYDAPVTPDDIYIRYEKSENLILCQDDNPVGKITADSMVDEWEDETFLYPIINPDDEYQLLIPLTFRPGYGDIYLEFENGTFSAEFNVQQTTEDIPVLGVPDENDYIADNDTVTMQVTNYNPNARTLCWEFYENNMNTPLDNGMAQIPGNSTVYVTIWEPTAADVTSYSERQVYVKAWYEVFDHPDLQTEEHFTIYLDQSTSPA